jgi:site-specific DNA-methyltransferase (adenine-specific)
MGNGENKQMNIINLDALSGLKTLPAESFDCSLSSPPYWHLRLYDGGDKEIGLEPTVQKYVDNLVEIYDEVHRVLKPQGTCFVNLGDTYHKKSLTLAPERFVAGMTDRGWKLRNTVIWHKRSCMPQSVKDRFTIDFEYVYFFTKQSKYFFNQQFEPYIGKDDKQPRQGGKQIAVPGQTTQSIHRVGGHRGYFSSLGRNVRTVWDICPTHFKGNHYAVMPLQLAERCLSAGCPISGQVIDPFGGAGTTALAAKKLGVNCTLIEINPDYCKLAEERLNGKSVD